MIYALMVCYTFVGSDQRCVASQAYPTFVQCARAMADVAAAEADRGVKDVIETYKVMCVGTKGADL